MPDEVHRTEGHHGAEDYVTVSKGPLRERLGVRLHRSLYLRSGGRVGTRLLGAPLLVLFTVGKQSGARRAAVLVYIRDGEDPIVAATNRGRDAEPLWLRNLLAQPQVQVQTGRTRTSAVALVVEPDDDQFPLLWRRFDEQLRGWLDRYQQHTRRPIRLVRLSVYS